MTTARPRPNFEIRLVRPGITPWDIPARLLARLLQAAQRLVDPRDDDDELKDALETKPQRVAAKPAPADQSLDAPDAIILVNVRRGSACYAVSSPHSDQAIQRLKLTGRSIQQPEKADWTMAEISALRELSDIARATGCVVEFSPTKDGKPSHDVIARIGPHTYQSVIASAYISGATSIFARIERVGGASEMHCGVRLPTQPRRMVICEVASADVVRELGQFIYRDVVLHGDATWLRRNLEVRGFVIKGMDRPKEGSIRAALQRIHAAGGKAWDEVSDPDRVVEQLRGR